MTTPVFDTALFDGALFGGQGELFDSAVFDSAVFETAGSSAGAALTYGFGGYSNADYANPGTYSFTGLTAGTSIPAGASRSLLVAISAASGVKQKVTNATIAGTSSAAKTIHSVTGHTINWFMVPYTSGTTFDVAFDVVDFTTGVGSETYRSRVTWWVVDSADAASFVSAVSTTTDVFTDTQSISGLVSPANGGTFAIATFGSGNMPTDTLFTISGGVTEESGADNINNDTCLTTAASFDNDATQDTLSFTAVASSVSNGGPVGAAILMSAVSIAGTAATATGNYKYWDGTTWRIAKFWNGTAWVAKRAKVWSGSAWQ